MTNHFKDNNIKEFKLVNEINSKIDVVIPAYNEEKLIGNTLQHLINQTHKPERIIVVNDGSTDKTREIALTFNQVEIVDRKNVESTITKKQLAQTYNAGLNKLHETESDYVLLLDADILMPQNYLSTIVQRMNKDPNSAVTSGIIKGEYSLEPRGGGRIVRTNFWKKIGMVYPVNYGFEGYLLWKARSMGYTVSLYSDLIMETQRKTGATYNAKNYIYYGYGLKALGYYFPYALGRILLFARKKPSGAYYMFKGYLEKNIELYEPELREFVKNIQRKNIRNLTSFKRAINLFNN